MARVVLRETPVALLIADCIAVAMTFTSSKRLFRRISLPLPKFCSRSRRNSPLEIPETGHILCLFLAK